MEASLPKVKALRPQPPTNRAALSPAEFGAVMGLSTAGVLRGCRAGTIRFIKIGRRVLIPADEPQRLMSGAQQ
jgi:hypothetical protein